ncbi:hypothetical protein D9M70_473220 [compost metagenome]
MFAIKIRSNQEILKTKNNYKNLPHFRNAIIYSRKEKRNALNSLFGPIDNYSEFSKSLIDEREWRAHIDNLAGEAPGSRAIKYFSLPEAGRLATYVAGILAIFAGIVIALIDKDLFYGELQSTYSNSTQYIKTLFLLIILPVSTFIYPASILITEIKLFTLNLIEWLDDDYLSRHSFYSFIKDVADLDDEKEPRLLRKTTGQAYWTMYFLTSPFSEYKNIRRKLKRAKGMNPKKKIGIVQKSADAVIPNF